MQNWDTMQTTANYVEHNNWYNNMFAANIKTEPGTLSPPPQTQTQQHSPAPSSASSSTTHLENYLKQQQQQQQQFSVMDTNMSNMTPSPNNTHLPNGEQHQQQQQFFDTASMHQQLLQQQQYQQHFQQAQQAAAQNQVTSHLPLGFNPLTPPGLPQAVLPAMSHFYTQSTQQQRNHQQTPSPQPLAASLLDNSEKSALTPRHTPPMDITPPKSPKASNEHHQDQELMSNSSEDLKYIVDSDDDETIRLPIYNSHGKMKNYKCKSCGMVAITKLAFWEHAKTHMKPEKILQCPKCPFVTELKHHLEYHIRKHKNLKPFQCDKCSYSCVNKSMLNSHRKSHSSVYQYRCADCDYATKYCHSFKLHLRKYDHKPGMVLDEEGIPNPSVVIDVYGTRRGPKNKGSSGSSLKKSNTDLKLPTSQLSAALQGFPMNTQNPMPASPAKSSSSVASELPALTLNMSLQQPAQTAAVNNSQISPSQQSQASSQNGNIPNLLPPLASLLQQNRNMAFFPYWNLNLQMLAAQQQAAVLAQLSPRMREQLQKQQQEQNSNEQQPSQDVEDLEDDEEDLEDDQEFDRKSVDSAMDLSQGTPTKEDQQQTPDLAMNLKLAEDNVETPLFSSATANRRKGRVLKLDHEQLKANQLHSAPSSPQAVPEMPSASSPIAASAPPTKIDDPSSADESMETGHNTHNNPSNTSSTSTASSSGNSSNSSTTASSSSATSTANSSPSATPTMYECKYCDIFFKDAVLYTIHMGYHSCDDVFKCNMCGEKCDGPVGLFVHMARNAHS